jgi:pimeloyl-ACP methyl ester carboxylesterase
MGHSLGGKLATMVAAQDSRVKALFAIDPVNGGNPFTGYSETLPDIVPDVVATLAIPVGFPGESWSADNISLGQSCAPAEQNYTTFYDAATGTPWKAKWEFAGADHMDFTDDPNAGGSIELCPDGPGDDRVQVYALRTLMTAFFRRHQGGETAMDDWLFGALMPAAATATHAP